MPQLCVRTSVMDESLLCLVCSMMPLVFLQVLEPFCPLSEQESLEPDQLEVNEPPCSTAVLISSQTELNTCAVSSDASSPTHKDSSCHSSPTDAELNSVPVTVVAAASLSDADSDLAPPLSGCTSVSQQGLMCLPLLSNNPPDPHSGADILENDSFIPLQSISEVLSDESCCIPKKNQSTELIVSQDPSQINDSCSLPVQSDPLV